MLNQMTFGSLFAGIGGIDLGLERAGMKCIWQVEIDDYCQRVLAKHWPDIPRYGDIHNVGRHNLETPDLICGGFPCQPVSVAGKMQAEADPRWLWPQFARVVNELRPRYVLVENVPGLYLRGGAEVIVDLATLGYNAEWDHIFAASVGAPHLRERIFIVAYTESNIRRTSRNDRPITPNGSSSLLADTYQECESRLSKREATPYTSLRVSSQDVANADEQRSQRFGTEHQLREGEGEIQIGRNSWWTIEPDVGRVAYGIPFRMDRLRALGNAVVPQVAEWVGKRILEYA